jgi:hypothetical protein
MTMMPLRKLETMIDALAASEIQPVLAHPPDKEGRKVAVLFRDEKVFEVSIVGTGQVRTRPIKLPSGHGVDMAYLGTAV